MEYMFYNRSQCFNQFAPIKAKTPRQAFRKVRRLGRKQGFWLKKDLYRLEIADENGVVTDIYKNF